MKMVLSVGMLLPLVCTAAPEYEPAARVKLGGDREERYEFGAVYRRYDRMAVRIRNLEGDEDDRLLVAIESEDEDEKVRREQVLKYGRLGRLRSRRRDVVDSEVTLNKITGVGEANDGIQGRPAWPVGHYWLRVWLEGADGMQLAAEKPFFIIFNGYSPADREVYGSEAGRWLKPELDMVRLEDDELVVKTWSLDIHHPEVFLTAMSLVRDAATAREAAERAVRGASEQVTGYWPKLTDSNGKRSSNHPSNDPNGRAESLTSAVDRLRNKDKRGQCFDYVMLSVALLRSVGIPARAVTATDPAPMPHPNKSDSGVVWNYHVWAEVLVDGEWHASDVTYVDDARPPHLARFVQPRQSPWFGRTSGPRTQYWLALNNKITMITERYQKNGSGGSS